MACLFPKQGKKRAADELNVFCNESDMENSKTVDHPDRNTVAVRQGTGPRATVSVLLISLLMAVAVGVVFLGYFYWVR